MLKNRKLCLGNVPNCQFQILTIIRYYMRIKKYTGTISLNPIVLELCTLLHSNGKNRNKGGKNRMRFLSEVGNFSYSLS